MDLRSQLLKAHSKENAVYIAERVGTDQEQFDQLVDMMYDKEYRIVQRAAHAISHCVDNNSFLIQPHIPKLIEHLDTKPHVAVRRNVVRILQKQAIPESHQGILVEHCFNYLTDAKETVAVKTFSMTILTNMSHIYPELAPEVVLIIEDLLQNNPTPGIKARGKKLLKQLTKISIQT